MKIKLTDRIAATARPGLFWDADPSTPRGFLLQVTAGGSRAYRLNYRVKNTGRERRLTIGDVATWPIKDARKRAAELRRGIDQGDDPLGEAQEKRAAPTVEDLARRFVEEALRRRQPRTQYEYKAMIDGFILPSLGRMKVNAVERADLERLHDQISVTGRLRRANAVLTISHVLFEQAIIWKMRDEGRGNPASRIMRNRENRRERYLSIEEMGRLNAALDRWQEKEPDSVDMIRLLLLTGARRGEVVGMRWADLDLTAAVWRKPAESTKSRRPHTVPLSPAAVDLLRERRDAREQSKVVSLKDDRVFRGRGAVQFRLERHWAQIRAGAQLEDVRLHDLRHAFASVAISQGAPMAVIAALLGHSSVTMTERYAHLRLDPLRTVTEAVAAAVSGKAPTTK